MNPRQAHILVVDCDNVVLSVTSELLARIGYIVHPERRSPRALRTFSRDPDRFDLAIIEPLMPQMSGVDLALRFREMNHDIPILFYTGYLEPEQQKQIEDVAVGSIILKPLRKQELLKAVEQKLFRSSSDNAISSAVGY